ncbi:unnamed protein product [Caenorhabditis angaria]|uniref:Uncharacterized protein n=1 Tax=Caenorhabditis angaria TaxID=860376 RepID=A0A9P1J5B0_9PELO|nr:unnamed protein product [Caenorhabditis angaria]
MEPCEPCTLQQLCNVKMMAQLTDIFMRRKLKEPGLPTLTAWFFRNALNRVTFNSKTQEQYKRVCAHFRSFLRLVDYTDFPSLKKDNTFDVREIAMFMEEMKRKGFVAVQQTGRTQK